VIDIRVNFKWLVTPHKRTVSLYAAMAHHQRFAEEALVKMKPPADTPATGALL